LRTLRRPPKPTLFVDFVFGPFREAESLGKEEQLESAWRPDGPRKVPPAPGSFAVGHIIGRRRTVRSVVASPIYETDRSIEKARRNPEARIVED